MWSRERGNRSRNRLKSAMGERRVPPSQVFLDASKTGLPLPCTSLCRYHPGEGDTACPQLPLEGASPSKIASAAAQLLKKLLARSRRPLCPGHLTGLEKGIAARVTPCSQRCWANGLLQPCSGSGRCPSHLHSLAEETQRKENVKVVGGGDGYGIHRFHSASVHVYGLEQRRAPGHEKEHVWQGAMGKSDHATADCSCKHCNRIALAVTGDVLQNHLKIDSRRASSQSLLSALDARLVSKALLGLGKCSPKKG